jgi:hypothetical protein
VIEYGNTEFKADSLRHMEIEPCVKSWFGKRGPGRDVSIDGLHFGRITPHRDFLPSDASWHVPFQDSRHLPRDIPGPLQRGTPFARSNTFPELISTTGVFFIDLLIECLRTAIFPV